MQARSLVKNVPPDVWAAFLFAGQRSLPFPARTVVRIHDPCNPAPFGGEEDCEEEFFKYLDKEIARLMKYQKGKASIDREKQQVERLRRHVPDGPNSSACSDMKLIWIVEIEHDLIQLERAQQMRLAREANGRD